MAIHTSPSAKRNESAFEKALTAERWNVARAATRLGMTRSSLYNKIKTFGIIHPNGQR
jgi:transcriptional regulator of acetoin/glycerol metabolism